MTGDHAHQWSPQGPCLIAGCMYCVSMAGTPLLRSQAQLDAMWEAAGEPVQLEMFAVSHGRRFVKLGH